mmetsp:Transcript_57034/g.68234  ORF Transcript_57034/g.68234 Transcript_57034/m.68234 type:complete len:81 (-) Transcript_57034:148-390(-)
MMTLTMTSLPTVIINDIPPPSAIKTSSQRWERKSDQSSTRRDTSLSQSPLASHHKTKNRLLRPCSKSSQGCPTPPLAAAL